MKFLTKKIICVLVCGLFFVKFLYDLTEEYTQYITVTNVHLYDLQGNQYQFIFEACGETRIDDPAIKNYLQANMNTLKYETLNRTNNTAHIAITSVLDSSENIYITWQQQNACFKYLYLMFIQYFEDQKSNTILKLIQSKQFYNPAWTTHSYPSGTSFRLSKLLPTPYDSDCKYYGPKYKIGYSHKECKGRNETCFMKFFKSPCLMIEQHKIKSADAKFQILNLDPERYHFNMLFELSIIIQHEPYLSLDVYFFCAFGLFGTFLEFAVYDVSSKIIKLIEQILNKKYNITLPSKFRKLTKDIQYLVIFLCVVYHQVDIIRNYLEYKHSTRTNVGRAFQLEYPKLSFCFPIELIKVNEFRHIDQSFDLINQHTYNISHIFKLVNSPTNEYLKNDTIFFWNEHKCLRVGDNLERIVGKSVKIYKFEMWENLNHSIYNQSYVFFQRKIDTSISSTYSTSGLMFKFQNKRIIVFDFIEMNLLPEPYETMCVNYVKNNCMNDCKKSYLNSSSSSTKDITIWHDEFHRTFSSNISDKSSACQKQCSKKECSLISWYPLVYLKVRDLNLWVLYPNFGLQIEMMESMSISNLILYCFSVMSFWTGISLIIKLMILLGKYAINYINFRNIGLVLLIFHSLYEFQNYMEYDMVTKVSYMFDEFPLPNIELQRLCQSVSTEFRTIPPKNLSRLCGSYISVSELAIMDSKKVQMNNLEQHEITSITENRTILFGSIFVKLDIRSLNLPNILHLDGRLYQPIYQIRFSNSTYLKYSVILDIDHALFRPTYPLYHEIYFSVSIMKQLPPPFATNCRLQEGENYPDCYERNIKLRNLTCTTYCRIPDTSTLSLRNNSADQDIYIKCLRNEGDTCVTHHYQNVNRPFGWSPFLEDNHYDVNIFVRTNSECKYSAKITFTTFMMILAGIFDLWLGVNLFWFMNFVADDFEPRFSKYRTWINNEFIAERNKRKVKPKIVNVWRASDIPNTSSGTPMAFTITLRK